MRPPSDHSTANTTSLAPTGHLPNPLPKPAGSFISEPNLSMKTNRLPKTRWLRFGSPKPHRNRIRRPTSKPSPKRSNPATRQYLRDAAGAKCASLNPTPAQN